MADRQAAVDRMLAEDPAAFWRDAAALTRQIDDWPMIRLLCQKAQASRDAKAIPWLVRSWAMRSITVIDDQRPEREAIESVTGRSPDQTLRSIVFNLELASDPATQVAAWSVLVRIKQDLQLRRWLAEAPTQGQSLLVETLRQVAPAVDELPGDRGAVARMMCLSAAYLQAQWDGWARWRAQHAGDGPATLTLRHLPAISERDSERDGWAYKDWLSHIEQRLANRRHATRGSGVDDDIVVKQRPERFANHAASLGIADLIVLDQVLDLLDDPGARKLAFEQAEADRADTTTELGGALVWDTKGRLELAPFAPLIRQHDQAYIASTACIEAVYTGLAHYHFHTQRYDNAAWAGPGKGDLDFAESHHTYAVVLTFLDQRTLNVDAYCPGGIVIDLGCMTR